MFRVTPPLMAGCIYFTPPEIESNYWCIPLHRDEKDKTWCVTSFGGFVHESLDYGLAGAPSTFQKRMDITLMGLKTFMLLFTLTITWFFMTPFRIMRGELKWFWIEYEKQNFKLSLCKCTFAAREIAYLVHFVRAHGISPNASNVTASKSLPLPRT